MTKKDKYIASANGIGIVRIEYGIDDSVVFRDIRKPEKLHHVKINYSGRVNFRYCGQRFYFDNFIRTNLFQ